MTRKELTQRALMTTALALSLAACGGGGGGSDSTVTPPVVVTTAQEDKFGLAFGMDFRASMNGEPAQVNDGDIVPVALTTEPIDITP